MSNLDLLGIVLLLLFVGGYIFYLSNLRRGRQRASLRTISAYDHLGSTVKRSAELGTAVHFSPGSGGLASTAHPAETLAGLTILEEVARQTAVSSVTLIATTNEGAAFTIADNIAAAGYAAVGRSAEYQPNTVRFITQDNTNGLPYIVGAADVVQHENVDTNIAVGYFASEYLILGEAGIRQHADVVAGTTDPNGLTTMVISSPPGRVLLGEEIFAGGAYLQGRDSHYASLMTQDIIRLLLIALIIIGAIVSTVNPDLLNFLRSR